MATDELAKKLERRCNLNEGVEDGTMAPTSNVFNPYTEFKEFSRKQIKEFEKIFKKYDVNNDKFLDLMELKLMMEKLEAPQTHVGLKQMINEVDEDHDGQISYREFLLIFRKAAAGELVEGSGLSELCKLTEVDVDEVGVGGAKDFFMSKINAQTADKKFEEEIKEEQEQRKREAEEAKQRKAAFKEKANFFKEAAESS